MTEPKDLTTLTERQLVNRINAANKRIYKIKEEMARRMRLARYGTETPELRPYSVMLSITFYADVDAIDEKDAQALVGVEPDDDLEHLGPVEWWWSTPGNQVLIDGFECSADIEEVERAEEAAA